MREKNLYFKFIKKYCIEKKMIILYILLLGVIIISAISSLFRPKCQAILIDSLSKANNISINRKILIIFLFLVFVSYIGKNLIEYFTQCISELIASNLKCSIVEKLYRIDNEYYLENNYSDIQVKIDKDIETIKKFGVSNLIMIFSDTILLIFVIPFMIKIDVKVTLINISFLLLIPVIINYYGKLIEESSSLVLKCYSDLISIFEDIFCNWKNSRLNNCVNYTINKAISSTSKYQKEILNRNKLILFDGALTFCCQFIGIIFIWIMGASKITNGLMSVGTMLALMNYQAMLTSPILHISDFFNDYYIAKESLKNLNQFMEYQNEKNLNYRIENIENIEFKNVTFEYKKNIKIFENLNFNLNKGFIYALEGKSGQGKTTIANLICGFLDKYDGKILVNNINLNNINKNKYREKISYVMQFPVFYNDSIMNNLLLVNEDKNKILTTAKKLNIYQEIIKKDKEWNTIIKKDNSNFSGGQIKRLDILRNTIKKFDLLILDEPTVGLDEINKEKVLRYIYNISKDKIIIIITHDDSEKSIADYMIKI